MSRRDPSIGPSGLKKAVLAIAIVAIAVTVVVAVIGGVGSVSAPPEGESYNATFVLEGECPSGSELWIIPRGETNQSYRFHQLSAEEPGTFEVVSGREYVLGLNSNNTTTTTTWVATSRRVVLQNTDSEGCSFD